MKVSLVQLETVLYKMKYEMLGYSNANSQDIALDISFTQEDPGNGVMFDCITIATSKPTDADSDTAESMITEIYSVSEKIEPRASITKSFKIKCKY